MSHAYQQVVLEEDSRKYVTINTHKGLYTYTRLPFGVASSPAIFQRTMEGILGGIPNVAIYLDDILCTGPNEQEHLKTLEEVLQRLEKSGLRLKRSKCEFMGKEVKFLGHKIDASGLHPLTEKVEAIAEAPEPQNVSELKAYLGLLNYYHRFLPKLSTLLAPLHTLLKKEEKWSWGAKLSFFAAQQQFGSGADTADEVELIRENFLDFAKDQDFAPALDNVVELTFTEAVKGVYKDLAVDLFGSCPRCGGTGHPLGTEFLECPHCDGSGTEVSDLCLTIDPCKKCSGSGVATSSLCLLCNGTGQTRQRGTVSVAVPAGVKDGQSASIPVGKKMIKVTFRVEESPVFRRDGDDVHSDMVISVADAMLGGTAQGQGLYGTIDIPIPPGTQADQKIRLAGKGFAHINSSSFGDHYVHIKIKNVSWNMTGTCSAVSKSIKSNSSYHTSQKLRHTSPHSMCCLFVL
uniref:ribonuclease H n=1 Tax=Astyanax mexicanus TaxID=7994 RepID=A0A3B1IIS6_ASTMX